MATTNPIRWNLQAGTIGSSLASNDATINFGQIPSFPTLNNAANGDYIPITLISSAALTNSEIVYVTGYTAGNSTGAIVRGQESASGAGAATTWSVNASWEHSPAVGDQNGPQAWSMGGNTTGTTVSVSAGTVTLAGGNNVTLSQGSNNGITISGRQNFISMYPMPASTVMSNIPGGAATSGATSTNLSVFVTPMALETPLAYNAVYIPASISMTTSITSQNWSATAGLSLGLYTLNGANLSLLSSWSHKQLWSHASTNTSGSGSITWNASWGGSATQHTTASTLNTSTATAAGYWTAMTGNKMIPLMTGSTASLPEGQYYMVVGASFDTGGNSQGSVFYQSLAQHSVINLTHLQQIGLSSTGGTTGIYPLLGLATVQMRSDTVWPLSIATANITTSSNNASFVNRSLYAHFVMRTT